MLILIFSSGLTCWVILQRHKHCVSSPDPSDATGSYVLEAADPYMLEVLEELNKTLVPDTAEITAADRPQHEHRWLLPPGHVRAMEGSFLSSDTGSEGQGLNHSYFLFINTVGERS